MPRMLRSLQLLFLFLIFILCLPLWADVQPWTKETQAVLAWKAVEDDAGGFYLLWTRQDPSGLRLMGQHVMGDGTALWTVPGETLLPVVSDTASWTAFADSNKGLALSWVNEGKVWVQRWAPDGVPVWKTPVQVSDTRFISSTPVGVADGGGGLYIVWVEKMFANRAVLKSQHLNAQAVPLWPDAIRISLRPSDQKQPSIAFDRAAGAMVSWADYRDLASDWRVQRINYQGFRLWGLEGIEITAPAGNGSSPLRLAPWGQGSLTVAWVDSDRGHRRVKERQINPRGTLVSEEKLPPLTNGEEWNPVLTGEGDGHYWVGWEDNRNERTWQVYVRSGTGGSRDLALAPSNGDQGHLALSDDNAQGVFAVWVDNRADSPAIYGQHLNAAGQALWEISGREMAAHLKHPDTLALLALGSGHEVLVWSDQLVKGQHALYWQFF